MTFTVTAMTLIYESEILHHGKFKQDERLTQCIDNFLQCESRILCVNTSATLLTSIKILQYLNTKENYRAEDGRIFISLDMLKCKKNRDCVLKAFDFESNNLLLIEFRHKFMDQDVEELYSNLTGIAKVNNKKNLIIIHHDKHANMIKKFRINSENKELYVSENDSIHLEDFEPKEDPLQKNVLVFQEQEERVSLAQLTGIKTWNSYVEERFQNKQDIIDIMTLDKILNKEELKIGRKPPGTSSLEGAYCDLFEEINTETFANKLSSQGLDENTNDIYIISGIGGKNQKEKVDKLITYLGLVKEQEIIENQLGEIGSDSKIQITDDLIKKEHFERLCYDYPEKQIFWISAEIRENELILFLQLFYNPTFYLKRKFKNVVIKKKIIEQLMNEHHSEIFIFYPVSDPKELIDSFLFEHILEKEQFEMNYRYDRIKLFTVEADAKATFQEMWERNECQNIHLLKLEEKQFIWCNSHGRVDRLRKYIDKTKIFLTDENDLFKDIKDRKVVIIADDPGMGKTTTLTKLYESKYESVSALKSHWIFRINLRDHIQVIKDMELKIESANDLVNVVDFLSKMDSNLNNKIAKSLLHFALDKSKIFSKPLLLAFDGFDEVLDEGDRNKIISLLNFLNKKTAAKIWITTRLHYKETLEDKLETIAIEFDPMNYEAKRKFITKYLKDRLRLILTEEMFDELFLENDGNQENKRIQKYIEAFLSKMESVFEGEILRFIGTPLQLNLMLEGSVSHFKNWIENNVDEYPNFNYLGNDIWEVYKKFINAKYDIHFKKRDVKERLRQKEDKVNLNQYNKDFAKSLIFKSKPKKNLTKFKTIVLSAGIIKSQGHILEFIHTSFRDYFAAKIFYKWIKQITHEKLYPCKQEYLLKEILKKRDYQLIRTFINVKVEKLVVSETLCFQFGKTIEQLLKEEEISLIGEEGTVLHVAAEEGNRNIMCFLLNSLKKNRYSLKKFLFARDKFGCTALHLACSREDAEIVGVLLNSAAGISEDALQEFLRLVNICGRNALHEAVILSGTVQILKDVLSKAKNKVDILENEKKKNNALSVACDYTDAFKKFLFTRDKRGGNTALHLVCRGQALKGPEKLRVLLDAAAGISEDTLQEFLRLTNYKGQNALRLAVIWIENAEILNDLFNRAKNKIGILENEKEKDNALSVACDYRDALKEFLFIRDRRGKTVLHIACEKGDIEILRVLLDAAARISEETLQKFLHLVNDEGQNVLHAAVRWSETVQILKDFLKRGINKVDSLVNEKGKNTALSVTCDYRDAYKKFLFIRDKGGNTVLHIACEKGDVEIVRILVDAAARISEKTLQEFLHLVNDKGQNALHEAVRSSKNVQILKDLLKRGINKIDSLVNEKEKNNALSAVCDYTDAFKEFLFTPDRCCNTVLHIACEVNDIEKVRILLDVAAGISKDALEKFLHLVNDEGQNALHKAVRWCKNVQILKYVLNRAINKVDIYANGEEMNVALSVACDYKDVLKKFLFTRDRYGNTALHLACQVYDDDVIGNEKVRILLDAAARISGDTLQEFLHLMNNKRKNALHLQVTWSGNVQILKELLKRAENKIDTPVNEKVKNNALIVACNCRVAFKKFLFTRDEDDNTALHLACRSSQHIDYEKYHEKIIILLDAALGISEDTLQEFIHLLNDKGQNALHAVVRWSKKGQILKDLLKIAINEVDGLVNEKEKNSALSVACDYRDAFKEFLFTPDKRCNTVLHIACEINDIEKVRILLDAAAGISEDILQEFLHLVNDEGQSVLHKAVIWSKNVEILKDLLNREVNNVDILANRKEKNTALSVACHYRDALKKFLFTPDRSGNTVLHIACEKGDIEKVRILLDAAAGISEDTLQEFLHLVNDKGQNAFDKAARWSENVQVLEDFLYRAKNKVDTLVNERERTMLEVSQVITEMLLKNFILLVIKEVILYCI